MRKLLVLFAILAGLFAFQGATAESLPREKTRTELVVKYKNEIDNRVISKARPVYFAVTNSPLKPQVLSPLLAALLISSQQHHASL